MKKVLVCIALLGVLVLNSSCESDEEKLDKCMKECAKKFERCGTNDVQCARETLNCSDDCRNKYDR